jgi:hypothetical protein
MTTLLYANNAITALSSPITTSSTVISVAPGTGNLFPSPVSPQSFRITLTDAATGLIYEILDCTSRSGDSMTVSRAQEGTTAHSWSAGDKVSMFPTAGTMQNLAQNNGYGANGTWNINVSGTSSFATNATNAVNSTNVVSGGTVNTNSIVAGTTTPFYLGGVVTAIDTTGGGNVFSANILNGAGTGFIATSATGASGFDYFGAWTQSGTRLAAIDGGGNIDGQSFNYLEAGKVSLTGVGYSYLFNGLLMQWGVGTYNNGDFVSFPIPMTNIWSLQLTDNNGRNTCGSQSQNSTGFVMSLPAQTLVRWLVLGSS